MKTAASPLLYPRLRRVLFGFPLLLLLSSLLYTHFVPYRVSYIPPIPGKDVTALLGRHTRTLNDSLPTYRNHWSLYRNSEYRRMVAAYETERAKELASPESRKPNTILFENAVTVIIGDEPLPGQYPEQWTRHLAKYPESIAVLNDVSSMPSIPEDTLCALRWTVPFALLKMECIRQMGAGNTGEAVRLFNLMTRIFSVQEGWRGWSIASVFGILSSWGSFSTEELASIRQAFPPPRPSASFMKLSAEEYVGNVCRIMHEPVKSQLFTRDGTPSWWITGRPPVSRNEEPFWDLRWMLTGITGYRAYALSLQQVLMRHSIDALENANVRSPWLAAQQDSIGDKWDLKKVQNLSDYLSEGYSSYWSTRFPLQNQATELAQLRICRILLDIEEYRRVHGAVPNHLDQLPAPADPSDRMDPFSDRPLIYRLSPTQYLVYSLGSDGKDNGAYREKYPNRSTYDIAARVLL